MMYRSMIMPDEETSSWVVHRPQGGREERRSGVDRRVFSYAVHIPERRSGLDRRRSKQKTKPGARNKVGAWGLQHPPHFKK